MAEFTISQDRIDFDQIRERLQSELRNYESWNDILDSSTGQMLLDFMASIGAFNQQGIQRALQEIFYDTQVTESAIYRLSRNFGINIKRKTPARVEIMLNNPNPVPFTIVPYSRFSIDGVDYFNRNSFDLAPNSQNFRAVIYQGTVRSTSVISNGQNFQQYRLGNPDYSISSFFDDVSQTGDLFAVINTPAENEVNTLNENRFEKTIIGLWHFGPFDKVFYENTRVDGRVEVLFGNNLYGEIPPINNIINFMWVETLGEAGNRENLGSAVEVSGSGISGVTTSITTGGDNERDPGFYKRFGSDIYSARRRSVTRQDYRALILTYPGVIDVLVEGQQDINEPQTFDAFGIALSSDTAYVSDRNPSQIRAYSLNNGVNVESGNFSPMSLEDVTPSGMFLNGNALDVINQASRSLLRYQLDTKTRQTDGSFSLVLDNNNPRDLFRDNNQVWVLDQGDLVEGVFYSGKVFNYLNGLNQAAQDFEVPVAALESLELQDGGAGYTTVPGITINDVQEDLITAASLTLTISNGAISAVTINSGGRNYTNPEIIVDPPSETTATGTTVISGGRVIRILLDSAPTNGFGYYMTASVTIEAPDSGTSAEAVATVNNGVITGFLITESGSGYTSAPSVIISAPDGERRTARIGNIGLGPREPAGIWFAGLFYYLSYQDSNQIFIYNRATHVLNDTIDLIPQNTDPAGLSSDGTVLYVVDNNRGNNQVYGYNIASQSASPDNNIPLTLLGRNSIRWMNIIRITLITREPWGETEWDEFITWLNQRAIATTEYQRNNAAAIVLNLDATVYCFDRVNLTDAENLISSELRRLFALQHGSLGRSYYLSNLYQFIESLTDTQGRIVDYLQLNNPVQDVLIQPQQYLELGQLTITAQYTERLV